MNGPLQNRRAGQMFAWAIVPASMALICGTFLLARLVDAESYLPRLSHATFGSSSFPPDVVPASIDFGTIVGPAVVRSSLLLRNPGADVLILERVETSGPCIQVEPASIRLGPHQTKNLSVAFDPSNDPEFRGGLSVDVMGYGIDRRIVFRTRVSVDVRTRSEDRAVASSEAVTSEEVRP